MTREEVYDEAVRCLGGSRSLMLELSTGFGKTRIAIGLVRHLCRSQPHLRPTLLLLVAKTVHKETWRREIQKWGGLDGVELTVECYNSLKNHAGESFTFVIADEAHHLNSDLRREYLKSLSFGYFIGLSATVPKDLDGWLRTHYGTRTVRSSLAGSIADNVLPAPQIFLLPLDIDGKTKDQWVILNHKAGGAAVYDDYANIALHRWSKRKVMLHATKAEKLHWLNTEIARMKDWYDRSGHHGARLAWLNLCGQRLKYLAACKNGVVAKLLGRLKDRRTLTFCADIAQTEALGTCCIHSRNKLSRDMLDRFNSGRINHITACQVLNEGVNLVNCQYGIFANVNASAIIQKQRLGRLLRHPHPIIILPFYKGTREQEIVEKMLRDYDRSMVRTFNEEALNA